MHIEDKNKFKNIIKLNRNEEGMGPPGMRLKTATEKDEDLCRDEKCIPLYRLQYAYSFPISTNKGHVAKVSITHTSHEYVTVYRVLVSGTLLC